MKKTPMQKAVGKPPAQKPPAKAMPMEPVRMHYMMAAGKCDKKPGGH